MREDTEGALRYIGKIAAASEACVVCPESDSRLAPLVVSLDAVCALEICLRPVVFLLNVRVSEDISCLSSWRRNCKILDA
ncbi:MAG: hypothetical protein IT342_04365 [Candidatus Melainabacteria bacterium]|nr:hypothetical protein [Candidatus Melainabacteria bacterium]